MVILTTKLEKKSIRGDQFCHIFSSLNRFNKMQINENHAKMDKEKLMASVFLVKWMDVSTALDRTASPALVQI